MRSRVLIGAAAWLLGVVSATTGSLYAVDQLGQGLLEQRTTQVSVAMVNAELALEHSERASRSPSPAPSPTPSTHQAHWVASHRPRPPAAKSPQPQPSPSNNSGKLLTSSDGTAFAVCKPAGAYLVYWSPQQGFEANHVVRGPRAVASVTFSDPTGGVVMKVTCSSGEPVAHLSDLGWHDE